MRCTHLFLATCLALILTGCQSQQTQLPDWVANQNHVDHNTISAIGEGISLKEAQANAKEALAAQLLSHVSNELTVLSINDGDFHRTYTDRLTQAEFQNIPLPATQFTKTAKIGYSYFTQISLDKETLRNFLSTNLKKLTQQHKQLIKRIQQQPNAFEQWWLYEQQTEAINQLTDQTLIHNSLFSPKNTDAGQLVSQFNQAYNQAKTSLELSIDDNTPIKDLSQNLEAQLNKQGIKTSASSWLTKQPELEASLDSKVQSLQGDYYATSTLNLTLKSARGQTLAHTRIHTKGVSISSGKDAKLSSYKKLLKELQKIDLIERLKAS